MNIALYRGLVFGLIITALFSSLAINCHQYKVISETRLGRDAAISDYQNTVTKYVNAQDEVVTLSRATELSQREYKKALDAKELQWIKEFKDYKKTESASSTR